MTAVDRLVEEFERYMEFSGETVFMASPVKPISFFMVDTP